MGRLKLLLHTGFFHVFGGSVFCKIVLFFGSLVLVRVISKTEYGIFTYASNICNLVEVLAGFGAASGALQVCSENFSNRSKFNAVYQYAMRFGSTFDMGLTIICLLIGLFVPLKIPGANSLICLMSFLPILSLWQNMQIVYLRANQENIKFAKLSLFAAVVGVMFNVSGAYFMAAEGMAYSRYITSIFCLIFAYCVLKVPLIEGLPPLLSLAEKKDILRISGVSMLNNSLSALLYLIDTFAVGFVTASETQVAAYQVATQIPNALTFIPSAVVTYIYPYFALHRMDKKWCFQRFSQVILGLGLVNLIIGGTLTIFAPFWIKVIFGTQYLDAVPSFRILCLGYIVSGTFRVIAGNLLVTQRKLAYNTFVVTVSGVINVICDFLFVSWWGIEGAALATLLVQILVGIMCTGYLIHILQDAY